MTNATWRDVFQKFRRNKFNLKDDSDHEASKSKAEARKKIERINEERELADQLGISIEEVKRYL